MVFPDRRTASVLPTIFLFAVALTIIYISRAVIVIFDFDSVRVSNRTARNFVEPLVAVLVALGLASSDVAGAFST